MTKIAVVGNCQVYGVKHALKELLAGATIQEFALAGLLPKEAQEKALESLGDYDIVFSQPIDSKHYQLLRAEALRSRCASVVLFPAITFTGFHPDQIMIYGAGGTPLLGASGAQHSAMVAAAFAIGFPKDRVAKLFNTYIFQRLGYFSEYQKSKDFLLKLAAGMGFNLERYFSEWQVRGPFMHTNNHPCIRVLATIARDAAALAGLCPSDAPIPHITYDALGLATRWPVYPEIARRTNVEGGYSFTRHDVNTGRAKDGAFSLSEFISASYEIYPAAQRSLSGQESVQFAKKVLEREVRL